MYRDEAPYLREWVEFHRLVGVSVSFSTTTTASTITARCWLHVDDGSVTIHDWPQWPAHVQTYDDCLKRHREDSRWIAFIDLDEFRLQKTPLPVLLREYEEFPGGELGGVRIVGTPDQAARARARVETRGAPTQPG